MSFGVAVMTAGVCYSIAERPGIVPGFIIGYAANQSKAGFLGGLLMAFVIGYFIQWMKTWKLPKWMVGLMPVMIIPVIATFVCGVAFFAIVAKPMAIAMNALQGLDHEPQRRLQVHHRRSYRRRHGLRYGRSVNKTASWQPMHWVLTVSMDQCQPRSSAA